MSTNYSPKIVSDSSLQFHIDINNPKSWKGPPTSNYFYTPTPNSDGSVGFSVNGTGTFYRIYSGTYGGYTIQPSDVVYKYNLANQSGCYYHGNDFALAGGNTCTWSFQYYVSPDAQNYGVSPGNNFISNLEGNIGAGFYANDLRQGVWENFNSGPLYINSTGTGRVLIYPGACNGTYMATSGFILFKNPQFELLPYATSFVQSNSNSAGTRSATQCLLDLSGNSNVSDVTYAGYDSNGNVTFNGSSNYISTTVTKGPSCTFAVWAKTTTVAGNPMLFNAGNSGSGPDVYFNNNQISWNTWDGTANAFCTMPSSVTNGNYHYYVIVNDQNSNAKLYYDGSLIGTATYKNASSTTVLKIGGEPSGPYLWNGNIPVFMVYNKALTSAEVLQNFNAQRSRFGV